MIFCAKPDIQPCSARHRFHRSDELRFPDTGVLHDQFHKPLQKRRVAEIALLRQRVQTRFDLRRCSKSDARVRSHRCAVLNNSGR